MFNGLKGKFGLAHLPGGGLTHGPRTAFGVKPGAAGTQPAAGAFGGCGARPAGQKKMAIAGVPKGTGMFFCNAALGKVGGGRPAPPAPGSFRRYSKLACLVLISSSGMPFSWITCEMVASSSNNVDSSKTVPIGMPTTFP